MRRVMKSTLVISKAISLESWQTKPYAYGDQDCDELITKMIIIMLTTVLKCMNHRDHSYTTRAMKKPTNEECISKHA